MVPTPDTAEAAQPSTEAPAIPTSNRLDANGRERPQFILDFPEDPQLAELVAAFERGDFAYVRENAPKLAQTAASPAVQAAARELRRRISPDPMVVWFLAASFVLLIFLMSWSYWG
jgi:hypothetical protein